MRNWAMMIGSMAMSGLVLAGCGGGDAAPASSAGAPAAAGGATTVTATMKDLTLAVDKNSGKAGEFTFKADNKGALAHELAVLKTDEAADKIPQKDAKADESTGKLIGRTAEIAAGKAESKTVKLEAGKYVLLCNVPAHYAAGMAVAFTVQ